MSLFYCLFMRKKLTASRKSLKIAVKGEMEIKIYLISESELSQIRNGSNCSLNLNLCLFFASLALTVAISLFSTPLSSVIFSISSSIGTLFLTLFVYKYFKFIKDIKDIKKVINSVKKRGCISDSTDG